ncbi:MAG TPA: hypothetical protein HPP95_12540 [Deltaproteobacteria bacterium]|nr:hypothetical protein [Deltaproteobacteria bacterium]
MSIFKWLIENREWIYSGLGVSIVWVISKLLSDNVFQLQYNVRWLVLRSWLKANFTWIFSGLGVFLATLMFNLSLNISQHKETLTKGHNESYEAQLNNLNSIQDSLVNLNNFVESQKEKLHESENLLESIRNEHATLKPIVEEERGVVDKIFKLQEMRSKNYIWKERVISFFTWSNCIVDGLISVCIV